VAPVQMLYKCRLVYTVGQVIFLTKKTIYVFYFAEEIIFFMWYFITFT